MQILQVIYLSAVSLAIGRIILSTWYSLSLKYLATESDLFTLKIENISN